MTNYSKEIDEYLQQLFPITRSIMGEGNRKTLKILQEIVPLEILEYPTGKDVYTWTIPKEWKIKEAWIKNSNGEKIIDMLECNLHVINYAQSINKKMSFSELKEHLHYLEKLPDAIPYRTSYYNANWGFCVSYNQYQELFKEGEEYEVYIDSKFIDGSLSIGELLIEGKSKKEYLISCYLCHPSMANDSLSGVLTAAFLAKELLAKQDQLEHSYRIVFIPETIGAVAYLATHEETMKKVKNGLVLTTCGGPGQLGYKQSLDKENSINAMIEEVFTENGIEFITYPFDIFGSDERQYSSQGFKINCVTISKDKYYEYDYYHTSLDNLDFVKGKYINETLNLYVQLIEKMDKNISYKSLYPNGEVMLSKYDLYPKTGGALLPNSNISALSIILWLLYYCDGTIDLYEISNKLQVDMQLLYNEAVILEEKLILEKN